MMHGRYHYGGGYGSDDESSDSSDDEEYRPRGRGQGHRGGHVGGRGDEWFEVPRDDYGANILGRRPRGYH